MEPRTEMLLGLVLVLAGVVLPFLMILTVLPTTLFLCFIAFAASVTGLFLGFLGGAQYRRNRCRDDG